MKIRLVLKFGSEPIEADVSQFVVTNDDGTPILVAGEFGAKGMVKIANAADADFNTTLTGFGYKPVNVIHSGIQPPPSNARLVGGPGIQRKY